MPGPDASTRSQRAPSVRGRAIRERAARAVRSTTPLTLGALSPADEVDQAQARAVIDLALRAGEALLSTGASAADVVATLLRLTHAYGLGSCHVDVMFTSISISYHRGEGADPISVLRVVRVRSADYTRLEHLQALVREVAAGELEVEAARRRLEEVLRAPHPYRRWLVTVALAVLGGAVGVLFGGSPSLVLLSAGTTAVVDRAQRWLARRGLPAFFTQAVGAAIPTLVAVLLLSMIGGREPWLAELSPSLIVAAGIVALLAGLSLVGAAQDALDGYYVTAGARGLEVILLTLGVVVGVSGVLALAHRAGVPMVLTTTAHLTPNHLVQVGAAMVVALSFTISSYTGIRAALLSTVIAGLGWVVYLAGVGLHLGGAVASGCAAAAVGVIAQPVSTRWHVPALAVSMAGIVPLLPGLAVYQGLFLLVGRGGAGDLMLSVTTLLGAAGVGMGLAAGVSLGTFAGRPLRAGADRWQRRALRRSAGDARE